MSAKNGPVLLLGEASYILYLIHPYVVYGVLRLIVGPVTGFSPFGLGLLTLDFSYCRRLLLLRFISGLRSH